MGSGGSDSLVCCLGAFIATQTIPGQGLGSCIGYPDDIPAHGRTKATYFQFKIVGLEYSSNKHNKF